MKSDSDSDKSLLSKGLNFVLPPASLEYSEYLVDFELFFRDMFQSWFKNLAFSSFKTYNSFRRPNNLTHDEIESLLKLSKNKNVVIQKSDKGNFVVLIDKIVYTNGIKKLLDNSKTPVLTRIKNQILFFIVNKKSLTFLRKLKTKIRLMRIYTMNYAQLVVNLESIMVLQKSIKRLLMATLLFDQFFQPLGHPRIR